MRKQKNKFLSFLTNTLIVYISLVGGLYFAQRNLMYIPDRDRPIPGDYTLSESVSLKTHTDDGVTLEGWYWPPAQQGAPVIVWFHGNGGSHADRISAVPPYLDKGYGVLLASYRGYAGNPGSPDEEGLYKDARAWIHQLTLNKGIMPDQIVLYGESLGTGVAVQMAVEYPDVRALVLQSPYTSLPDVAQRTYFFVPVALLMKDQFRSIDKIKDVTRPLLVFEAAGDLVVPADLSRRLYEAAVVDKKLVSFDGTYGHNTMPSQARADAVEAFLRDNN